MAHLRSGIWGLALATSSAAAQSSGTPTELKPEGAEHPFAFSSIEAAIPLRDGRIVVADPIERTILLLEWNRPEPARLGRSGQGPNEYVAPRALFRWLGDSLFVHDIGASRYLILTPDGTPARTFRGPATESFGYIPVRAVDRLGRIYAERRGSRPAGVDMEAILRWSPTGGAIDTAALISRPVIRPAPGTESRPGQVVARPMPFRARDEWVVAPEGRVSIVHADPFHVESVLGTARTRGPDQPYRPRPVTEEDKAAWREQQVNQGRARTLRKPGESDARTGAPTTIDIRIEEPEWSETMPPFLTGGVAIAPDGQVWVTRVGSPKERTVAVDLFDGNGRPVRTVLLPRESRIVGFGAGVVLVARTDESGLQYLRRFRY
ncbi:MAG: hypothetical protein HOP28_02695 [Gemmatimonadales bacterium]|nr:hypothetical protein [Gemmatimonadales bacterium]